MSEEDRLSIFIATSQKASAMGAALAQHLTHKHKPFIWRHDFSHISREKFATFARDAKRHDLAIVVYSDDPSGIQTKPNPRPPRDTAHFATGFLMGTLGNDRVILLTPESKRSPLPSEIADVLSLEYRTDVPLSSAAWEVYERVVERIDGTGLSRKYGAEPEYAAAICYRKRDSEIEFLLVKTTRGKWTFPKGLTQANESAQTAAIRHARDEAGIFGRIDVSDTISYMNLKEEIGREQNVTAYLINVAEQHSVSEQFRAPTWFNYSGAEAALSEGRVGKYPHEVRRVLQWAAERAANQAAGISRMAGALPYRITAEGRIEVLLITSKVSGNWLIPKGHIADNEDARTAAIREAEEEAGVRGRAAGGNIGRYSYRRVGQDGNVQLFDVEVFPFEVLEELEKWSDMDRRVRQWFPIPNAAAVANEAGLKSVILSFPGRGAP